MDETPLTDACPTCQGRNRETTDMVCMTCGRDYLPDDGSDVSAPGLGWKRLMRLWRQQCKQAEVERDRLRAAAQPAAAEALAHEVALAERDAYTYGNGWVRVRRSFDGVTSYERVDPVRVLIAEPAPVEPTPADSRDPRFCSCGAERGHAGWAWSCRDDDPAAGEAPAAPAQPAAAEDLRETVERCGSECSEMHTFTASCVLRAAPVEPTPTIDGDTLIRGLTAHVEQMRPVVEAALVWIADPLTKWGHYSQAGLVSALFQYRQRTAAGEAPAAPEPEAAEPHEYVMPKFRGCEVCNEDRNHENHDVPHAWEAPTGGRYHQDKCSRTMWRNGALTSCRRTPEHPIHRQRPSARQVEEGKALMSDPTKAAEDAAIWYSVAEDQGRLVEELRARIVAALALMDAAENCDGDPYREGCYVGVLNNKLRAVLTGEQTP